METELKNVVRGFAAMTPELRRKIAAMGGAAQGKKTNSGNFANNRQRASEAGRKGGSNRFKNQRPA